jgi:effector-binding domain-containing protein
MPSGFASIEELPQPNDSRVSLDTVPARLVAAARFSGRLDEEAVAEARTKLAGWMEREGLVAIGETEAAQFDAPWKPGFVRHNEILVPARVA